MVHDSGDAGSIAGLQQRDPNALAEIYDRYGQIVYSVFFRITHDEAAAQDLVQELFLRVWNRARAFDPGKGSLGTWILSVARHMAIDHVRSADVRFSTRLRPLHQADQTEASSGGSNPETVIDQTRTINTAFAQLNPNQKRVLELAYFEGFSQSEIAAKLDEPLGTVKSWMRSAIGRLRLAITGSPAL